jgi:hypothetical protein
VFRALVTPSRTTVRWGAPLIFEWKEAEKPSREALERVTGAIFEAIARLDRPKPSGIGL